MGSLMSPLPEFSHLHGAVSDRDGVSFCVWAPLVKSLSLELEGRPPLPMVRDDAGYFSLRLPASEAPEGTRYGFRLPDGRLLPDPASRFQPDTVHGLSQLVRTDFAFANDSFPGIALENMVIQEIHVGTFTPKGTLDAASEALPRLAELGINAVELMPLAAFDGERGWGYDGVQPFALHRTYGGPAALARFVDAAHGLGIAVILDVVFNHFGPSGCYEALFGPWFTKDARTPWGEAIDYGQRPVRDFIIQNALFWLRTFHLDGLRLDAVHAICDDSPVHILTELSDVVRRSGPTRLGALPPVLIGESHLNDRRFVLPAQEGGHGLDSQWSDDFHHAVHALMTGEKAGYYADYGTLNHVLRALRDGQTYTGQHSDLWNGPHGTPTDGLSGRHFVVFLQNHDQAGNRPLGERLSALVPLPRLKLAAAALILSPFIPLLFMGEEWAESAPFLYFTDFPDAALGRAVTDGRRREFRQAGWTGPMHGPQEKASFFNSKIHPERRHEWPGREIWDWYRSLVAVRRSFRHFAAGQVGAPPMGDITVRDENGILTVERAIDGKRTALLLNFSRSGGTAFVHEGNWDVLADSHFPRVTKEESTHIIPAHPLCTLNVDFPGSEIQLEACQALFIAENAAKPA